ncbi:MAG: isoprenylcysteine carboxylmethyltransferase family protein [Calditrichaeota bacterium]|nr:MAG: isoprenylcysteine carboxylmethyltransferase family protein [Calditrichota bacterium]
MSLKSRWIDLLYRSATSTKKVRTLLTPLGLLVFGSFLFLFVFLSIQTDHLLNWPKIELALPFFFIALVLVIPGAALTGWSVIHFLKVKGTPVPLNPPPVLVTSGPYAHTRNPMLTGVFMLMFGIGFWIGSLSLILLYSPLFILVNALELKFIEEPELVKRLGEDYIEYRSKTPMFVPALPF